jgi:hypothetical protein
LTKTGFMYPPVAPGFVASNNLVGKMFLDDFGNHLVKEGSQNTADAAALLAALRGHDIRAVLEFEFKKVARAALEPFGLSTAITHAAACKENGLKYDIDADAVRVLTMVDHSGGLNGNVTAESNDHEAPLGRYLFSVGTGVSGKGGKSNGRHGIGSGTGAMASKIRLMYVFTRRLDGTSVASARLSLPTHTLDGEIYASDARLGVFDDDGIWLGILEGEAADELARAFGFNTDPSYAGLSVAIIEPLDSITAPSIVETIVTEQFYQIEKGLIEFTVKDADTDLSVSLGKENIDGYLASEDFTELKAGLRKRGGRPFHYDPFDQAHDSLRFVRSLSEITIEDIDNLETGTLSDETRKNWIIGKPVACRLPVTAAKIGEEPVSGHITFFLKKIRDGQQGSSIRVRDAIVNVVKTSGYMGLTLSSDDDIAVMLGDCEDPAHVKYLVKNASERGWADPLATIVLFKSGLEAFRRLLVDSDAKSDRISLAHIFPLPGKALPGRPDGGSEGEEAEGEVVVPEVSTFPALDFKENLKAGTVTLTLTTAARKAVSEGLNLNLRVSIDYARSKKGVGSFSDGKGNVQLIGAEFRLEAGGSVFEAFDVTTDFKAIIHEVDFKRDLVIDHTIIDEQDLEEAA